LRQQLQHTSAQAVVIQREEANHHEPHLGHRRVGHDSLQIQLPGGHQPAVDHAGQTEHEKEWRESGRRNRKEGKGKTQEATDTALDEHRGHQDRNRTRRREDRLDEETVEGEER